MSFKRAEKTEKFDSKPTFRCVANNCPLNGSISTAQDKWMCGFHFRAEPTDWPRVSDALYQSEALLGILDDLHKVSEVTWSKAMNKAPAQRDLYMSLFDDEPELKPRPDENKSHYEYRLRDHISRKAGVLARRIEPSAITTKSIQRVNNPADYF